MNKDTQKKERRILGRVLAKELTLEELNVVAGGQPPISTLVATLPSYREDQ